jgi:sulfur-carrier protein adenylyltransferase/sulfurtransferase
LLYYRLFRVVKLLNMNRYQRQIDLPQIGTSGQQKLTDAKVLVIGAGGLGYPVLQHLAAAGVGSIGVVDGDVVEESNLHRQLLYTLSDCGKNKAMTTAEVLMKQNPNVKITPFPHHFNRENAFKIVEDYQIIADCTDTLEARYLINDVALVKGIPFVYASIHQFEGQLSVFNYKEGPTYRCLFPEKSNLEIITCDESGVLGVIPNIVGVLQATEVLKIILEIGEVLSGKLLLYDGLYASMQTISIEKNPLEIQNGLQNGLTLRKQTQPKAVKSIDKIVFLNEIQNENNLIIDLREDFEEPKLNSPDIQNIPIDQLEIFLEKVDKNQKIILLCQYGNKSQLAANYISKIGYTKVSHLHHGIESLEQTNLSFS